MTAYKPTTSSPLRTVKANSKINHLILLPPPSGTAPSLRSLQFAGTSYFGEIYRFGDSISKDVEVGTNSIKSSGEKQMSIWQEMFGKDAFLEVEGYETIEDEIKAQEVARKKTGNPAEVYEGASHTLPPVSLLFDSFLEQILVPKSATKAVEAEETIVYEQEDAIVAESVVRKEKLRDVKQEDVDELEAFFRDTLKTGESSSTS
jgi:NET1-associated nuclear protein 1 (U3 small nucleolar RNA-associated protein 17)